MNFSNRNINRSPSSTSPTPTRVSPPFVVRSIISSYLQNNNLSVLLPPIKLNARVHPERKYGEDITDGQLLQQLREKTITKTSKK